MLEHELLSHAKRGDAVAQVIRKVIGVLRLASASTDQSFHNRQQVLDPMLHLANEKLLFLDMSLPLANVTRDLRRADDRSSSVSYQRDRDLDVVRLTVATTTNGFEAIDALACTQIRNDIGFLMKAVFRDDERDELADRLFG